MGESENQPIGDAEKLKLLVEAKEKVQRVLDAVNHERRWVLASTIRRTIFSIRETIRWLRHLPPPMKKGKVQNEESDHRGPGRKDV